MKKRIVLMGLLLFFAGCQIAVNPKTGEKEYSVDPNRAGQIETQVGAAAGILGILAGIWPVLGPIGGAILAGLATWRKIKPKLTEAQGEAKLYHSTTAAVVGAVEDFKNTNPAEWKKLKERLEKVVGPNAENVIRALRGLPPKE